MTGVIAIATGQNYSAALTADGRLASWGLVPVGNAAQFDAILAVAAGGVHGLAVKLIAPHLGMTARVTNRLCQLRLTAARGLPLSCKLHLI